MTPQPLKLNSNQIELVAPNSKEPNSQSFLAIFLWCRPRPSYANFSQWLNLLESFGIPKKKAISVFDFESARALLQSSANSSEPTLLLILVGANLSSPDLHQFLNEAWQISPQTLIVLATFDNLNPNLNPPFSPFFRIIDLSSDFLIPPQTFSQTTLDPHFPTPPSIPPQSREEICDWLQKLIAEISNQKNFLLSSSYFPSIASLCSELLELLENSNTGILLLDSERRVLQINRQIVDFLGLAPADCHGKPIWDLFDSSSLGAEFFARVQSENRTLSVLASPLKPLPGRSQFLAYAKLVPLADSKSGFLVFLRNRSFEAESRERLRIQETILNQVNDAIFLFDLERRVTFWNPAAERLYRLPAESVLGKRLPAGIRFDSQTFAKAWQECIEKGQWNGEMRQIAADGQHLTVHSRWSLLRGPDGEPKGILVANLDITERSIAHERELRAQRLESIGTMVGGIAHDMNNILQPISISIQLLSEKEFDPETRSILQTIQSNLDRASKMIRQILTFARGVEGESEELYVEDFLSDVEHFIRIAFPKNIHLDCQWPQESKLLQGNPTQLYQAVINLCVNARDAMPNGGTLQILVDSVPANQLPTQPQSAPLANEYVRIQIKDSGPGIPPDLREKILEPFFSTKPTSQGTGLGLSTTLQIVRKHGGILYLDPDYTSGANFHIYLPVKSTSISNKSHAPRSKPHTPATEPLAAPPSKPTSTLPQKPEKPERPSYTILLVDDEPAVLAVLKISLEKAGHHTLTAKNGHEALELFRNNAAKIQLIITDVAMPEMSGLELISAIRAEARSQNLQTPPIIATTGMATPAQIESIQAIGVEKILSKPYGSKMLIDTIREVVESRAV